MIAMKEILLTNGGKAIVDEEDYLALNKFKWHGNEGITGRVYAKRKTKLSDNRPEKIIYMHRQILCFPDRYVIDHINGDSLDNRRSNLRLCTHSENIRNSKNSRQIHSGGYRGVSYYKRLNKWRVKVKQLTVGYFESKELAALAYNEKAREIYGEYAVLNILHNGSTRSGEILNYFCPFCGGRKLSVSVKSNYFHCICCNRKWYIELRGERKKVDEKLDVT